MGTVSQPLTHAPVLVIAVQSCLQGAARWLPLLRSASFDLTSHLLACYCFFVGCRWRRFIIGERIATGATNGAMYCRCPFHAKERSPAQGATWLYCSRSISTGRRQWPDETKILSKLKLWAISGCEGAPRGDHMRMIRRDNDPPQDMLPSEDELTQRRSFWDDKARAMGIRCA